MDVIKYVQGWIGMVGILALGNTISCFRDHSFLSDKLYSGHPEQVNPLSARLFGIWTLLAAILRMYCSINIRNQGLYNVTFASFVLAFLHFISEVYIFKSAKLSVGVVVPLFISGVSMLVMGVGYHYIDQDVPVEGKKHRNKAKKQLLSYGMKVS